MADRFEFGALAALGIGQLMHHGGAQRFGALVGLHGIALQARSEFFAERAGIVGLGLAQAGDVVAEIDRARTKQQNSE